MFLFWVCGEVFCVLVFFFCFFAFIGQEGLTHLGTLLGLKAFLAASHPNAEVEKVHQGEHPQV